MNFAKFKRRKYIEKCKSGPRVSVVRFKKASSINGFQALEFSKKYF